jgi:hypothetical protein
MATLKKHNEVPIKEVPEVAAFEAVQKKAQAFREANPEFFEYLDALVNEYNTALEAAEKAVRNRQVTCGDFVLYQFATKYFPDPLFDGLGHDQALAAGGIESTRTVRSVDKARVDSAIAAGVVPAHIASQVCKKEPRFKKPNKMELP